MPLKSRRLQQISQNAAAKVKSKTVAIYLTPPISFSFLLSLPAKLHNALLLLVVTFPSHKLNKFPPPAEDRFRSLFGSTATRFMSTAEEDDGDDEEKG